MKAVVFHKPIRVSVDAVEDLEIEKNDDVFFKSTSTAICGFDLHILNGFIPQTKPIIMGYEFVGILEEIKNTVTHLKVGDCIVVPSPIAYGHVLPLTNTSRACDKF